MGLKEGEQGIEAIRGLTDGNITHRDKRTGAETVPMASVPSEGMPSPNAESVRIFAEELMAIGEKRRQSREKGAKKKYAKKTRRRQ